eukprot:4022937-Prymnesium_polylepis.2
MRTASQPPHGWRCRRPRDADRRALAHRECRHADSSFRVPTLPGPQCVLTGYEDVCVLTVTQKKLVEANAEASTMRSETID